MATKRKDVTYHQAATKHTSGQKIIEHTSNYSVGRKRRLKFHQAGSCNPRCLSWHCNRARSSPSMKEPIRKPKFPNRPQLKLLILRSLSKLPSSSPAQKAPSWTSNKLSSQDTHAHTHTLLGSMFLLLYL